MNEPSAYETTKDQTPESGCNQIRSTECDTNAGGQGTPETEGPRTGDEYGGIPGKLGTRRDPIATYGSLNGGILRQLIETERERLGEAQECIEWYEKQVEKCQKRLAELAALDRLEREQRESKNGN